MSTRNPEERGDETHEVAMNVLGHRSPTMFQILAAKFLCCRLIQNVGGYHAHLLSKDFVRTGAWEKSMGANVSLYHRNRLNGQASSVEPHTGENWRRSALDIPDCTKRAIFRHTDAIA